MTSFVINNSLKCWWIKKQNDGVRERRREGERRVGEAIEGERKKWDIRLESGCKERERWERIKERKRGRERGRKERGEEKRGEEREGRTRRKCRKGVIKQREGLERR
jgi:hypothetical protein